MLELEDLLEENIMRQSPSGKGKEPVKDRPGAPASTDLPLRLPVVAAGGSKTKKRKHEEGDDRTDEIMAKLVLIQKNQELLLKQQESMMSMFTECLTRIGVAETRIKALQETRRDDHIVRETTIKAHEPTPHVEQVTRKPRKGGISLF